jgi:hypothetical protein
MAFFRFSRDKRGYEHFYLVEPTTNRRGKVRQRVLYWFRSPPDVRVGREPFDEGVRRALEAQYPDVTFDWPSILEAPIPSADADKWRERRRAERAAKHVVAAEPDEEPAEPVEAERAEQAPPEPARAEVIAAPPPPPETASGDGARKKRRRRRGRRTAAVAVPGQPSDAVNAGDPDDTAEPTEPTEPTGD